MKKILLIDDDDGLRRATAMALRKNGYEVVEAASGEAGLPLARSESPDLVLSDVNMPGLGGFEVLQHLRAQPATSAIPVILITGNDSERDSRLSMEKGADDYLAKPFEMASLLATVQARLERQQTIQEQAKEHEALMLEMLSATQDLVAMADAETGRFSYLNSAGRRMLEINGTEDVSRFYLNDFYSRAPANQLLDDHIAQTKKNNVWVGQTELTSQSGRAIPVSMQILPHRLPGGEIIHLSIVARDISALRKAERERQLMEVQLRQAQKLEAIGQLAAGIAHEINTPTQYVGDNTRFLKDAFEGIVKVLRSHNELIAAIKEKKLSPQVLEQAEKILAASDVEYLFVQIPSAISETLEGVERVTKIVRAMKEFSHPGGQEKSAADLNQAIESTVTVARNEWKYVAELKLELEPGLPPVPCFVGEFNQVILNLIINAAHAIGDVVKKNPEAKGLIMIRTRQDGDYVDVRVSDTGTGIPEAHRLRIFEPFFTTKDVGRGTGQGLALVYTSVVKKHGGTVTFETEIDKGTTFIIRLPINPKSGAVEK